MLKKIEINHIERPIEKGGARAGTYGDSTLTLRIIGSRDDVEKIAATIKKAILEVKNISKHFGGIKG